MLIGEYVRLKRAERGLTQDQLSKITGINRSYLSRLEKGHFKQPSLSVITRLAGALNIYTEELIRIVDIDAKIIQPDMLPPLEEYIALKFNLSQQMEHGVIYDLASDFYKSYFMICGSFPPSETRDAQYIKVNFLILNTISDFQNGFIDETTRDHITRSLDDINFNPFPGEHRLGFLEIEDRINLAAKEYKIVKQSYKKESK